MDKQTYTVAELSRLIGISTIYIYSAKNAKNPPMPGSKSGDVLEAMRKHGIDWDQIVSAPKGGGRKATEAPVPDDGLAVEASVTAPNDSQVVPAVQEMPDAVPTSKGDALCARWPLDMLIQAVQAKLPAHTSITISN